MLKLHVLFVIYLQLQTRCVYGSSVAEQLQATTQLCCDTGKLHIRSNRTDCSAAALPDVPNSLTSICTLAMNACCMDYLEKKKSCDAGVALASDMNRCDSLKQLAENCCNNCLRGKALGARGEQGCTAVADGGNDEEQLSAGANALCCKQAARETSANAPREEHEHGNERTSTSVSVFNRKRDELFSVCDEYSPHELCAHHCIPIPGSYKCVCNDGFRLMRDGKNCMEVAKNRCKHNNICEHKCNDNGVEVKCSCRRGYELMPDGKSCQDIDECSLNPPICLSGSQCLNLRGSYKCVADKIERPRGQCPPGYKTNVTNGACDDINECELIHPPCLPYSCENTVGSYKCGDRLGNPFNFANPKPQVDNRCPQGFRTGLDEKCEDVNECDLHEDNCNPLSQFCINMKGSFHCQNINSTRCPPGFHINPATHRCEDTDECEDGQNVCPEGQVCVNTLGEFDCVSRTNYLSDHCPEGMRAKPGTNVCEDIDECAEGTHLCDSMQNCLNMNGSYECNCKIGYHLDNTIGSCVDINECAAGQHNCIQRVQRCDNTIGSFLCIRIMSCGTGYVLQHTSGVCEDIDECALGTHDCDRAGKEYQCVNIPGAFSCEKHKSAPIPEPEYYDSEEYYDEEDNTTIANTGKAQPITTTTLHPEPSIEYQVTTPRYIPTEKPPEPNQDTTTAGRTPEVNVKDNEIDSGPLESNNRELNPIRPTEDAAPTQPPSYVYDPILPLPETPNYPNSRSDSEITDTPDTRYNTVPKIDITENSSPTIIYLPEETATVKAERTDDGAVVVDTQDVPKNVWTNINNRPMDCQAGFEMDDYGACFDIDECATSRHHCSGMTEICRNTMGGYICDCAIGFRRNLASGACDLIAITPSTTSTPGVPPEINPLYLETTTPPPATTPPSPPTTPPPSTTPPPPPTTPPPPRTTPPPPPTTPPPPPTTPSPPPTTPPPPPTTPPPPSTTPSPPPTTPPPPPPPTTSTETYFYGYLDRRNYTPRPFRAHSTCDAGYHYNSLSRTCEDIDECTNGQANCASVEICVNTEGGYRCECPPNWVLDDVKHRCVPIRSRGRFPPGYENAPGYPSVLVVNQDSRERHQPEVTRFGEQGSVIRCPWGFKIAPDNSCEDIDECATGEARCGPDQICVNSRGGYTCRCPPGHRLTADHVCEDVNECSLARNRPICSQNADCVNTIGSYKCVCHSGFVPAPANDKVCIDVDECTEARPGSLCQHRCNNVWGSYRCSCYKGYRLNSDNRTCSDVDECQEYKSKRLCIGYCQNEPGSYRCTCPSGYRLSGDKKSCTDINECETGEAPCANSDVYAVGSNDVCLNTRGGYRCQRITCLPGYRLEEKHRCKRIENYCQHTDWDCIHQPTSYSYHFITFVSNLYIPDGKVILFTMRGPKWTNARMKFSLRLVSVNAPPTVKEKADFNAFQLVQTSNEAMLSLTKPLIGPQSIELELSMELYDNDLFGGIAVAKLYIFVSEHEF